MALESEIGNIIPYALGIAASTLGLWWKISSDITAERQEREKAIDACAVKTKELTERLTAFELEVTRNFVPAAYQEKMEARFLGGLERLTSRLETVIARIEGMGNQLTRIDTTIKRVDDVVQNGKEKRHVE